MELADWQNFTYLYGTKSMIRRIMNHDASKESMNPWPEHDLGPDCIHRFNVVTRVIPEYNRPSGNKQKAYFCNAKGVFPIPKGNMSPAAPSLVVLGENTSAISVTLRVGSLSRMVTAEERPITPAPTTATEAILLGNHARTVTLAVHTAVKRKKPTPLPVFAASNFVKSLKRKPARLL